CLADGAVLLGVAPGSPRPRETQRAPATDVLLPAVRGHRVGAVRAGDLETGAARAPDGVDGRVRVGALLAFPGDALAGRAVVRPRIHGLRRGSVLAAGHRHRRLRPVEVAGG